MTTLSDLTPETPVLIAPNDNPDDCCSGRRGRVLGVPPRGEPGKVMVYTTHQCPIPRLPEELIVVSDLQLAREWFMDVEPAGMGMFVVYADALRNSQVTVKDLEEEAKVDPTIRHFLALWKADIKTVGQIEAIEVV